MAKKKSKTQKYKKSQKKKIQKVQNQVQKDITTKESTTKTSKEKQLVPKDKVKYNVAFTEKQSKKKTTKETNNKQTKTPAKTTTNKKSNSVKEKQLVSKDKVNYNVVLNKNSSKKETVSNKDIKKTNLKENINKIVSKFKKQQSKNKIEKKKKVNHKIEKEIKKTIPKEITKQELKKKNIIIRLFYEIKNNLHIIFNTIIIVTFIILLIGLIRINVFKTGTIVYICSILLFLMLVAISYNRYLSGKIFTLLITAGMSLGIYYMQYTYDFIRNLNSNVYEYKTYYVVAFDTTINRSIYTINNKKVGLLKENCINIERKLNTKLDKVNYIEYDDINELFSDFYSSKFKAILVNENQYNYLKNNIEENSRNVKILYEFKANAKK